MRKLIRWARGQVRVRITGGFPERFINLCAGRRIPLWDLCRNGEGCIFSTWAKTYPGLRPCARTAGVKMRVIGRRGLPFLLYRHRARRGIWLGAAACLGMLIYASGFLWRVEVTGFERLEQQTLLEALERQGVRPGARLSSIDPRSAERRLMLELDDLGWAAVNLQGNTAVVRVRERTLPPPSVDREEPCNVVALREGQITEMRVYVGQNAVQKGDAVARGDILVSGVVEDAAHDIHLVAARADVFAETRRTLTVKVPLENTRCTVAKVLRRHSIKAGGFELPLWVGKPPRQMFRLERSYTPLRLWGRELPLALGLRQYLILKPEKTVLTREQAKKKALARLTALEQAEFPQAGVLERALHWENTPQAVEVTACYRLEENIARQAEIFLPEGE